MNIHRKLAKVCLAVVFFLSLLPAVAAQSDLVSRSGFIRTQAGSGHSTSPGFSANGSNVVFLSQADDLVGRNRNGGVIDVYSWNAASQSTELVSVNLAGKSGGNGNSIDPSASANGRRIAFSSTANDLVPGDTNNASDIFVRDLDSGSTILVSVGLDGPAAFRPTSFGIVSGSFGPQISPDGRFVVFESWATNLVADPVVAKTNIYLRDLTTGLTRLLNTNDSTTTGFHLPVGNMTDRYVVYATVPPPPDPNPLWNSFLYVADLITGSNSLVELDITNSLPAGGIRFDSVFISTNGQYLAFRANSTNGYGIFRHNRLAGTTDILFTNVPSSAVSAAIGYTSLGGPTMSADGRFVSYDTGGLTSTGAVWDSILGTNIFSTAGNQIHASDNGRFIAWKEGARLLWMDQIGSITNQLNLAVDGISTASNEVFSLTLSADGSQAVMEAFDGDLVVDDWNHACDVFLKNITTGTTTLISRRSPQRAPPADGISSVVAHGVSTNGRLALLVSQAENLVPNDTNGFRDVFVRDLMARTNTLVSVAVDGFSGRGISFDPVMSLSGRHVAFVSRATNLVANDINNVTDIFWRDLETGETRLVSGSTPYLNSSSPSISANGRRVVFDRNGQINAWDSTVGTPFVTSLQSGSRPMISPDGNLVVFYKTTANSGTAQIGLWRWTNNAVSTIGTVVAALRGFSADGGLLLMEGSFNGYVYNTTNGTIQTLVSSGLVVGQGQLSANGQSIAFVTTSSMDAADNNNLADVYVTNWNSGQIRLVSVSSNGVGAADGPSRDPFISPDGRYVGFRSLASNLVPGITDQVPRIYLRDLTNGTTTVLSGGAADDFSLGGASIRPSLGLDGRSILYLSDRADLLAADASLSANLFVLRLPPPGFVDTDGDGMDDAWEVAHFGDLSHTGTTDSDGDGQSDLAEYLAGTDPGDPGSRLRFLQVQPGVGSSAAFKWEIQPGRFYHVQYKASLADPEWTDLTVPISIQGSTASVTDTTLAGATQRYYRVALDP